MIARAALIGLAALGLSQSAVAQPAPSSSKLSPPSAGQLVPTPNPANGAAAVDGLGQCLAMRSTGADRVALAKWMLAALGSAPQMKGVAAVTPEVKDAQDRAVAALFTRLMTVECLSEAQVVAKLGNASAGFRVAGGVLGRLAMQELMGNPEADAALGAFAKYINEADFAKLRPTP